MLNFVPFGAAVFTNKIFYGFPYISLYKSLSPWARAIHDLGTSF